jgi:ribosomal protein S13
MKDAVNQLQQIKGIGAVLAQRLVEAGIDSFERLAGASEAEMLAIKGMLASNIPVLQEQAREFAVAIHAVKTEANLKQMLEDAERLREGMENLVLKLRDQQPENDDSKVQRNLRKEITRILATLERVESSLSDQFKRIGRKLAKAEAKLTVVAQDDVEALTKGLRDSRKTIDKIVRP